ncbi:hypothetical protein KHC33_01315 [Methanospirillum sp. J.3.6.1-F.2.7.3]|uniref:Uncharacterized protein n=1 Tax=Methanospirillum purgamenti TaxID=2834276 RepID=A0A8E7EHD4_9EURY|nr:MULTISPECIES: hypothetical protein [Methanospirillum]MDX8549514.1 hypothetical protein [Methanospirillum hungatei]QVV89203.1 hypothetical protein KHC33_01315 [Methanospirillum sp. J.3.6.1-F.2.7.3]
MDILSKYNRNNIIKLIYTIIALIPIIYGFIFIYQYSTNIPMWDQWSSLVPWTLSFFEGDFQIKWIINAQNDSRAPFSFLIMIFFSLLSGLNVEILYLIGYIFYILSFLLIFFEFKKDIKNDLKYLFLFLPIIFYWFNPFYLTRYIYNLGGFTSGIIISLTLSTALILERSRRSNIFFGCSILIAVICSFSGAWGLAIWLLGIIQITLQKTQNKIYKIGLWIICSLCTFYVYYIGLGFREGGRHGTDAYTSYLITLMDYPLQKFLCYMGTIGSQIISNNEIALIFGILLTCIFIGIIKNNRDNLMLDRLSKWYALLVFWGITSLALTLTRSGNIGFLDFGPPDTIFWVPHFRHSPTTFFILVGIYIIGLFYLKNSFENFATIENKNKSIFFERNTLNVFFFGMIFTLLICGSTLNIGQGIDTGNKLERWGDEAQYYLLNYNNIDKKVFNSIPNYFPDNTTIFNKIKLLEKYQLNIFSKNQIEEEMLSLFGLGIDISHFQNNSSLTNYHIDYLNDIKDPIQQKTIIMDNSESTYVILKGWVVDSPNKSLARAVFISVDNEIIVPCLYLRERKDVASYLNNTEYVNSGFWGSVNISQLNEGNHTVKLKIVSQNENEYYQSDLININLKK